MTSLAEFNQARSTTSLLITGLLYSGSSAVKDLLSEYSNIKQVPGEFDDFRLPGMVFDQVADDPVTHDFSDKIPVYIRHFLRFKSFRPRHVAGALALRTGALKNSVTKRLPALKRLNKALAGSISREQKLGWVRKYLDELVSIYADENQFLLFDQPILWGRHLDVWPKVFAPFKMIVVYRNPLDQIADIVQNNLLYRDLWGRFCESYGATEIYGYSRQGALKFQIAAITARMNHVEHAFGEIGANRMLMVCFDRLVVEPERQIRRIEAFLGDDQDAYHSVPGTAFLAHQSQGNVGLYSSILDPMDEELIQPLVQRYLLWEEKFGGAT